MIKEVEKVLVPKVFQGSRSFGQRAADGLASWVGSWTFIILFLVFIGIWIAVNIYGLVKSLDPYPFILLNLILSCLAALQAPIILMSQNRQTQKDRRKMEYDYEVNRKAEKNIERILKKMERIGK